MAASTTFKYWETPAPQAADAYKQYLNAQAAPTGTTATIGGAATPNYAPVNPATGKAVQSNPLVNGTKAVNGNYSDSPVVVSPGNPSNGKAIGETYVSKDGSTYIITGIGNSGNPITQRVGGTPYAGTIAEPGANAYTAELNAAAAPAANNVYSAPNPTFVDTFAPAIGKETNEYINWDEQNPLDYDYTQDPVYQSIYSAMLRDGRVAANEAYARAATRTGGLGNSFANASSDQALNYYLSTATDKIPELEKEAYKRWLDSYQRDLNDVNMLLDQSNIDYSRFNTDRNYELNAYQTDFNNTMNAESQAYSQAAADREYALQLQQLAQSQEASAYGAEASAASDAYKLALERTKTFGFVSASDAGILGVPAGTPIASLVNKTASSGSGSSGSGSSAEASSAGDVVYEDADPTMQFSEIVAKTFDGQVKFPDAKTLLAATVSNPALFDNIVKAVQSAYDENRISKADYDYFVSELENA